MTETPNRDLGTMNGTPWHALGNRVLVQWKEGGQYEGAIVGRTEYPVKTPGEADAHEWLVMYNDGDVEWLKESTDQVTLVAVSKRSSPKPKPPKPPKPKTT
jgi:hypothetical protein